MCEAGKSTTAARMWIVAVAAIAAIVLLDILLVPTEHVALCSVVFSSAIVIVLVLLSFDVNKSCE